WILVQKMQVLLFLVLLAHMVRDAEGMAVCCTRKPRSCRFYLLLCRAVYRKDVVGKMDDTAAGILILGEQKLTERRYQDRLQNLLQSSRNQAAGLLTIACIIASVY
uniref:Hypocretin neuropeptide precursor n=1 Tax=Electrophorus electricus TaxID=8005 RepID=A0A4W4EPM9_ELEEL